MATRSQSSTVGRPPRRRRVIALATAGVTAVVSGLAWTPLLPVRESIQRAAASSTGLLRSRCRRSAFNDDGGDGIQGSDQSSGDSLPSGTQDRLAQIQAAIRRGEERAARAELEGGDEEVAAGRRMTPEEEELLKQFMVDPEEVVMASPAMWRKPSGEPDPIEVRINRTLEFCPDGVLAKEILEDLIEKGEQPGAGAFDAVLEALGQRGALDDALSVFKAMQRLGVDATDQTYDALARPASRSGEFRFVETLYRAKASERNGQIGTDSLVILLDAYANGLPRQAGKAEAAFRGAMAFAEEANTPPSEAVSHKVLAALRRAVGPDVFSDLCKEYELAPEEELTW